MDHKLATEILVPSGGRVIEEGTRVLLDFERCPGRNFLDRELIAESGLLVFGHGQANAMCLRPEIPA